MTKNKKKKKKDYDFRDGFGIPFLVFGSILALVSESFEILGFALLPYFIFWIIEGLK